MHRNSLKDPAMRLEINDMGEVVTYWNDILLSWKMAIILPEFTNSSFLITYGIEIFVITEEILKLITSKFEVLSN